MPQHFEKRIVPYSAAQMFDLVADVGRYPAFLPWCLEAKIGKIKEKKFRADLLVGGKAFRDTFTSVVSLEPVRAIRAAYGGGPLEHLENAWEFKPLSDSSCEISFFIDFKLKSRFMGAVMDIFFDAAFCRMVEAFEKRARELYA